jgi:L-arginine dehydrogenase
MRFVKRIGISEARRRVSDSALLEALRRAFASLHSGESQQPRETKFALPGDRGDCIFYPALDWTGSTIGVNVSPLILSPLDRGKSVVTAYTLLLSARTGEPIALFEAMALTALRTAAVSHLAASFLCNRAGKRLTIVGAGALGLEHARMARDAKLWGQIVVTSPSLSDRKSPNYATRAMQVRKLGSGVEIASDVQSAISGASVVMLCTSSGTPVVQSSWFGANLECVISISTNAASAHEIPVEHLPDFDVFCDYRATAPLTAGEMILACKNGTWDDLAIKADLAELAAGARQFEKSNSGKVRYFRSTGLGLEDAIVARLYAEAMGWI